MNKVNNEFYRILVGVFFLWGFGFTKIHIPEVSFECVCVLKELNHIL